MKRSAFALLLMLCACRDDRAALGPEDLLLNADTTHPSIVETTISGMVYCGTCPPGTAMILEVRDVRSTATDPLLTQPYPQFGAYQGVLKVPEKTLLAVQARVFAPGGTITDERQVEVPEGNATVSLTVDLDVP